MEDREYRLQQLLEEKANDLESQLHYVDSHLTRMVREYASSSTFQRITEARFVALLPIWLYSMSLLCLCFFLVLVFFSLTSFVPVVNFLFCLFVCFWIIQKSWNLIP